MSLDLGYQSALYLLGILPRDDRTLSTIVVTDGDIYVDWECLENEPTWSNGERLIIESARSLFRGSVAGPGIGELCTVLDEPHLQRVIDAMRLRAGMEVHA